METTSPIGRFGSGRSVRRIEDEGLLRGVGSYTDDVVPEGQLRLVFVRSPYPHARIVSVDTSLTRAARPSRLRTKVINRSSVRR